MLFRSPISKFSDLSDDEKKDFLSYEVSIRYLKNASDIQIKDIFQRINSTEYALNATERINAQWGDSEFICFAKQIIEDDLAINMDLVSYKISKINRDYYLSFFHKRYNVFSETDINRMLSLQFMLTLIATICEDEYFNRNIKVEKYIQELFEEYPDASTIDYNLIRVLKYIDKLKLNDYSYWFNKANLFSLIVELYKFDLSSINRKSLIESLINLENDNSFYLDALKSGSISTVSKTNLKYIEFSREGVNGKPARDYRGKYINKLIKKSIF